MRSPSVSKKKESKKALNYTHMYVHTHTHTYAYTNTHAHTFAYTHFTHARTYAHAYTRTHTRAHTYTISAPPVKKIVPRALGGGGGLHVCRAARLIFCAGRTTHTTPLLQELHWLPLQKRISYKLCLYVYKILQHSAPTYLEDMISVYTPTRTLRSMSDKTLLTIPRSALVVGDKSFSVSASRQWNSLPLSLRECHSLDTFKKHLKTYFFSL